MRVLSCLLLAAMLAGCAMIPSADQPAAPSHMGRFLGLVASCGCSDITTDRMMTDYAKAAGGRYSPDDLKAMKGYVQMGTTEHVVNQSSICAGVCSNRCMVNTVVAPLGGKTFANVAACPVTERDLNLEDPKIGPAM